MKMKKIKKHFSLGLVVALGIALAIGVNAALKIRAADVCDPQVQDLIAGQHIDAGDVIVKNDNENLYITYQTEGGWEITETHFHVADSLEGIPQTKKGNPIPGQFDYKYEYDPAITKVTYTLSLDEFGFEVECGTELFIATHAVVQKVNGEGPYSGEANYYPFSVYNYEQGLRKDGTPVRPGRSVPEQGLELEGTGSETDFFSLGFDGWLIAEFDCPIRNGEGNDVSVVEDTWGTYPLETADVYASQDGESWVYLGTADNVNRDPRDKNHTVSEFDLGSLKWAKYIKVVDTTDPAVHNNAADGFDLNAIESLQDCMQEETAWGYGPNFPGKNWAMYFTYVVCCNGGGGTGHETAFAYGGDYAICFLDLGFSRWGWTNGALVEGDYTFDIYAGAGRCDLNKGTLVGKLVVSYHNGTAVVIYKMTPSSPYTMSETHLYVGNEKLPRDGNGNPTVAPGQYPYIHDPLADVTTDKYTIPGLSGRIYVVAHAVVGGFPQP